MGADARIHIWPAQLVQGAFPDADKLFEYIPTAYKHEICGQEFYHTYEGDGMCVYWDEIADCYAPEALKPRIQELIDFLLKSEVVWEVWT
jgi:hypothetical protein